MRSSLFAACLVVVAPGCVRGLTRIAATNIPTGLSYADSAPVFFQDVRVEGQAPVLESGAAQRFTIAPALPAGLLFDGITGAISGVPVALSPASDYTVVAENSDGTALTTLKIAVIEAPPTLSYGQASYVFVIDELNSTGVPQKEGGEILSCKSADLPAELSLNPLNCEISGIARTARPRATYHLAIEYSEGTVESPIDITLSPELTFESPTMTMSAIAESRHQLRAMGGEPPYTFAIEEGEGSIDADNVFQAPLHSGVTTLRVTDNDGRTATSHVRLVETLLNGSVYALASQPASATSAGALYIGGIFSRTQFVATRNIIALKRSDASPAHHLDLGGGLGGTYTSYADRIVVDADAAYVSGTFLTYRGATAHSLAKISLRDGSPDPSFDAGSGFAQQVIPDCLAVAGDHLFVGGFGNAYQGQSVGRLIAIDKRTGGFKASLALAPTSTLRCVSDGETLYVSAFDGAGGAFYAAFDTTTLEARTTFDAAETPNFNVTTLAVDEDALYIGGTFASKATLRKLDKKTGAVSVGFVSGEVPGVSGNMVTAIASHGGQLFVGTNSGANTFVALDATSGALLGPAFNTGTSFDDGISEIAAAFDGIYVIGGFTHYRGGTANRIAKIDRSTGALVEAFATGLGFDLSSYPRHLALSENDVVIAGQLSAYRGVDMRLLAKLDFGTFALTELPSDGATRIEALLVDGETVIAGGTMNGGARRLLADGSLDAAFTAAMPMTTCATRALTLTGRTLLFGTECSQPNNLRAISLDLLTPDTSFSAFSAGVTTAVTALASEGNDVYVSGDRQLFALTKPGSDWTPSAAASRIEMRLPDGSKWGPNAIVPLSGTLLLGGLFTSVDPDNAVTGNERNGNLTVVRRSDFTPTCPEGYAAGSSLNTINAMANFGAFEVGTFLGGGIGGLDPEETSTLVRVDRLATRCNKPPSTPARYRLAGAVSTLRIAQGMLFVGGTLFSYNDERVSSLIAIDPDSGARVGF